MLCLTKCYEQSKIFKYGYIQNNNDIIDVMFCNNCINLTQLVCESKLNKKQKRKILFTILSNEQFLAIAKKYKITKKFSLRAFLCVHKEISLLLIYYKIKLIFKKLCRKIR